MALDQGLSFAGEVSINEVTIITTNGFVQTITNQVIGIQLFEDMFNPWISGQIIIKESHDFINLFPLVGKEFVRIDLSTPGLDEKYKFRGEFFIYKLTDRIRSAHREQAYVLHFVSKEAIIDVNKKISKTFAGKISDTVKAIVEAEDGLESKKNLTVEPTANNTKHISNFWSPLKNINYLSKNAVNADGSPTYIFFENKFGMVFASLDGLLGVPTYQQFIWDNYSAGIQQQGTSYKDFNEDYRKILEFRTPETFDYMARAEGGMYESYMKHYDLVTKKYTDKNYNSRTNIYTRSRLNNYPAITDNHISRPGALGIIEHKYYGNFNGYGDVTNTKILQDRISLLQQFNQFKIEIVVFGRMDYSIGQIVNLRVFKTEQLNDSDDPEDYLDKIYSGNYFIAAISHTIDREKHECTMELIKDSYMRPI